MPIYRNRNAHVSESEMPGWVGWGGEGIGYLGVGGSSGSSSDSFFCPAGQQINSKRINQRLISELSYAEHKTGTSLAKAGRVPGKRTLSTTWITPLSAMISAITTFAIVPVPSAIVTPSAPAVMHRRSLAKIGLK